MIINKSLAAALVALGLTVGLHGAVSAAAPHGPDGHAMEMYLDNGRKWQTDEALRTGMGRIRDAVDAARPMIHAGGYGAAEFSALADRIQEQVDDVVTNCKLPEQADVQLHLALAQVMDGIYVMKWEAGREQGALAIVQALDAYGEHFDHPGWKPLGHR
ncbi:hypothetical protein [Microvirga tunisiensis]|uniref:DnrO protein n=1 Tax=Microvirga tunisiensis TaxID=2108360 RepID=A0A5N7MGC2_9HYPH|nr:hypothetical protein [Microvirga tunisiensis]MPR06222.1 hypothetical protein [Microvirga tunisiensis]MPR26035.1 hypothetical protein [Microvirga tunisiensis]